MQRQLALGVTEYRWKTRLDNCVCRLCMANEGKVFRWDAPPITGHPGSCLRCDNGYCRCRAEAL
ncbi:hypothetical protein [Cupriavidus pauculus]|uniref:hypothetical protein n=1 Tax=Cupriavidus pauculus TaxID=82633 RepID=UPI0038579516